MRESAFALLCAFCEGNKRNQAPHLPYISPISPLHLAYISPDQVREQGGVHRVDDPHQEHRGPEAHLPPQERGGRPSEIARGYSRYPYPYPYAYPTILGLSLPLPLTQVATGLRRLSALGGGSSQNLRK